jgi:hypothetical protein
MLLYVMLHCRSAAGAVGNRLRHRVLVRQAAHSMHTAKQRAGVSESSCCVLRARNNCGRKEDRLKVHSLEHLNVQSTEV